MTKWRSIYALVPTPLVAAKIEDFYNIIALKIETGQFRSWAPSKEIILILWDFELSFTCDKMIVPWSFVYSFVLDMGDWSSRAFTGLYEVTVRGDGPLSGLVFLIKMKLRDR